MSTQFGIPTAQALFDQLGVPVPDNSKAPDKDLMERMAFAGVSPRTAKIYRSMLRQLEAWHGGREITDQTVALYVLERHNKGRAPRTVKQSVDALRFRCRARQEPDPTGPLTEYALRKVKREGAGRGRGSAQSLRKSHLDRMCAACDEVPTLWSIRDAAVLCTAFDAGLRIGEVSALLLGDVTFRNRGALVTIRQSKTDQEGAGAVQYVRESTAARLRRWIRVAQHTDPDLPLFNPIFNGVVKRSKNLKANALSLLLKKWGKKAGISGPIRFHGLRRGAAATLTARGCSIQEVQEWGRWRSPEMVFRYRRGVRAERGAIARFLEDEEPQLRAVR